MIDYCPSQHTPFDDEPDWLEIAELWLKQNKRMSGRKGTQYENELYAMIEGLTDYITENI